MCPRCAPANAASQGRSPKRLMLKGSTGGPRSLARDWLDAFRHEHHTDSGNMWTMTTGPDRPEPAQAKWFRALGQEISEDYARLHQAALRDPQRAGHGGEATWVNVLAHWLPPAYKVVTRKYIVPEIGNDQFETDIVILNPSYPDRLHVHEEILAGGVAAAFSVKLTLDAAGIRDGVSRAVELRRALKPRFGTPKDEMAGPFPVGILAHSHDWKAPASTPEKNITDNLWSLDQELVRHPRESLDYLCVSDLGMWSTVRTPYLPLSVVPKSEITTEQLVKDRGVASTSIMQSYSDDTFNPLALLVAHLYVRLSYFDSTLRPLADNLRATGTLGAGGGQGRVWEFGSVYTDEVSGLLPSRGMQLRDSDWASVIF
jgi:hypothetical protein